MSAISWRPSASDPALIEYRTFRNSDPPLLAELWRSQASQRGLMQPMSAAILDLLVLSKPIFDREGLILAIEHDDSSGDEKPSRGRLMGFVHVAFGPRADLGGLSNDLGVTCMLMVRTPHLDTPLAAELLARGEQYLRGRGAKTLLAGGARPYDPFYLGLYGGSELGGILKSDTQTQRFYAAHGYQEGGHTTLLHRDLGCFRPVIDRRQMALRRRFALQVTPDPPAKTWWEACTFGSFDRFRYDLVSQANGKSVGSVTFWDMQPLSSMWGVRAAGLVDLEMTLAERRQGAATFLMCEAFKHLQSQGYSLIEAQVASTNVTARAAFDKMGFTPVDESIIYRKD